MPFLTKLIQEPYDSDKWRLVEDFDYVTKSGIFVRIPKGFVHDLASIPRPFNLFFRKHGNHTQAAVLHDWCYYKRGYLAPLVELTRTQSDELFLDAMEELGVGWFKRYSMFYAVRLGGSFAWSN